MSVPHDRVNVLYKTPVAKFVTGVSGQRYHAKPNQIMIDVVAGDAAQWVADNLALYPDETMKAQLTGYRAVSV